MEKPVERERVELQDIMRPVSSKTKARIATGLSKEGMFISSTFCKKNLGGGRADYLRARKSLAPSEKFNFQACSSWDYGWSIAQFQANYKVT